ncbi:MAG: DNA repair protein RecO [Pseudoflavonifractor sp.]|nr:DNA repair protein RecO [Pseudoflavonifractor sp.]
MYRHLHCIALRTVKYNDRHSILTAYSRETGRVSFLIPGGAGREAARRRALSMPLSLFECTADIRPGREIPPMRDPSQLVALHDIHTNPVKNIMALFIAELLQSVLRESQEDAMLFRFLYESIVRLDTATDKETANFHICFLYKLTRFTGIEPDTRAWRPGRLFDMDDATFRDTPPLHTRCLNADESAVAHLISRMTWDNMSRFRFSRADRRLIIDRILSYYSGHYTALSGLHSLDILRQVLD